MKPLPKVRKERLFIEEVAGELLIYDEERHEAHCLNSTAALVWKHCDGQTSVTEISHRLGKGLPGNDGKPVDERLVWSALDQFKGRHLLQGTLDIPTFMLSNDGFSRRRLMRALGVTIVALPLVTSLVSPTAAEAASCLAAGATCGAPAQCCSGLCVNSICGGP